MKIDLKRLAQIVEIDHARSFARAAETLGISQPALDRRQLLLPVDADYSCRSGFPLLSSLTRLRVTGGDRQLLARRPRLSREDLRGVPLVATPLPERLEHIAQAHGHPGTTSGAGQGGGAQPQIQVNSFDLMRRIVLESDAIGIAPPFQLADEITAGSLALLESDVPGLATHYGIITLSRRTRSPAADAFIALLQEVEASVAHARGGG